MAGPQRCQASAACSHWARVVALKATGSKVVVMACPPARARCVPTSVAAPGPPRAGPVLDRAGLILDRDRRARPDTAEVKEYNQYCPVALGSEVLAERWVPLIVRELVLGGRRFNEIDRGLPGISRSLLKQRLDHLERKGVVERVELAGRGHEYRLTPAGATSRA